MTIYKPYNSKKVKDYINIKKLTPNQNYNRIMTKVVIHASIYQSKHVSVASSS
jgi:hypothetical protein